MKYIVLTAIVFTSAATNCNAQFNFKGALKQIGGQVQRQVSSQVKREIQRRAPQVVNEVVRHVRKPKYTTLPHPPMPVPKPQPHPKPCPTPIVRPLPYPAPAPTPCKIRTCPPPKSATCSIKPCPTPVEPESTPIEELPEVESGQQVTIDGKLFGPDPGAVAVKIGDLVLEATVTAWKSTQATAILPELPMAEATQATVVVITAHGHIADSLEVQLLPPSADRSEPAPVDDPELPVVSCGQEVTLEAEGIGAAQGKVQVQVGGLTLNATVTAWSPTEATAVLPQLSFAEAVEAEIRVLTADGQIADQVSVLLTPATDVASR